jgi:membrane protein implicated in regulation of membrane protease activity
VPVVSIAAWLIAALALAIAEIVAPGIFLIFLALGALVTGVLAIVVADLRWQLVAFVVASAVAVLCGRSFYKRLLRGRDAAQGIGRGPIGEQGTVVDAIVGGRGKIKLRDSVWLAAGPDLPVGTKITVLRREGTLLHVGASERVPFETSI